MQRKEMVNWALLAVLTVAPVLLLHPVAGAALVAGPAVLVVMAWSVTLVSILAEVSTGRTRELALAQGVRLSRWRAFVLLTWLGTPHFRGHAERLGLAVRGEPTYRAWWLLTLPVGLNILLFALPGVKQWLVEPALVFLSLTAGAVLLALVGKRRAVTQALATA